VKSALAAGGGPRLAGRSDLSLGGHGGDPHAVLAPASPRFFCSYAMKPPRLLIVQSGRPASPAPPGTRRRFRSSRRGCRRWRRTGSPYATPPCVHGAREDPGSAAQGGRAAVLQGRGVPSGSEEGAAEAPASCPGIEEIGEEAAELHQSLHS
jgi:hypothetical protein